jgi:hypothetical protein
MIMFLDKRINEPDFELKPKKAKSTNYNHKQNRWGYHLTNKAQSRDKLHPKNKRDTTTASKLRVERCRHELGVVIPSK